MSAMAFNGIADADQLTILTKLLDASCFEAGIAANDPAKQLLVKRIMALFNDGMQNPGDIKESLKANGATQP
jgi:hypothetical protein